MDYCIRKLLGLTDKNFITDENWLETVTENYETVHKIKGTWTDSCASCLYCSSKNVIKHSPMEHKIRIPHLYGNKTILDLKVQRFICKDCYKRQSKNVQKWEFKNVQFYSFNTSFNR